LLRTINAAASVAEVSARLIETLSHLQAPQRVARTSVS
jgi:hypothetical protein